MNTYTVITTRREFKVEGNSFEQAVHLAGNVLKNEQVIIIALDKKVDINYTDGVVKAKR